MPTTFKSVSNYYDTVEKLCSVSTLKVICGNKCDLDNSRRIKNNDLSDKAEEHGIELFFETSALSSEYKGTIDAMFNAIVRKLADPAMADGRRGTKLKK